MNPRPIIGEAALRRALTHYPTLGALKRLVADGLSVNTAACLFETDTGVHFAKRFDPRFRDAAAVLAEHRLTRSLVAQGFPTPGLYANTAGSTLTALDDGLWALGERARGEDRYGDAPVFDAYGSHAEAEDAGRRLAQFHLALADVRLPARADRGLRARFTLPEARHASAIFGSAAADSPLLAEFLSHRAERAELEALLEARRAALAAAAPGWPCGVLHGDFIKRNMFWEGDRVASVIDLDLWDSGPWLFDLALALLPCGFDWPALLAGTGSPRGEALRAMLAGYGAVRPLEPAEAAALPTVMEAARAEFYLAAAAAALEKEDAPLAERFWGLLVGTLRYFEAHPRWAEALSG